MLIGASKALRATGFGQAEFPILDLVAEYSKLSSTAQLN